MFAQRRAGNCCSHEVLGGKAGVGWGDLRFHVASFRSQRIWGKPAETHAVLQQRLLQAPPAPPASPAARVAHGESLVAQGPCHPIALPPPPAGRMLFLLESQLFWVRPGHESLPRGSPRCRPVPGKGCAAGRGHRLPVCTAFLSPLPPAPAPLCRRLPLRKAKVSQPARWRGRPCPPAAETLLFPFVRQGLCVSAGFRPQEGFFAVPPAPGASWVPVEHSERGRLRLRSRYCPCRPVKKKSSTKSRRQGHAFIYSLHIKIS